MKTRKYVIRYDWKQYCDYEDEYYYSECYMTDSLIKCLIKFLILKREYKIMAIEFAE